MRKKNRKGIRVWREGNYYWIEHVDQQIQLRNFWELTMELAFRLGETQICNEIRKRRYKISQEEFLQLLEEFYGHREEVVVEEESKQKKRRKSRSTKSTEEN